MEVQRQSKQEYMARVQRRYLKASKREQALAETCPAGRQAGGRLPMERRLPMRHAMVAYERCELFALVPGLY